MSVMSYDDLRNANPGQDMGTVPKNIARAAKDGACGVFNAFPDWFTGARSGPFPSPAGSFMSDLCRRNPPALSPAQPRQSKGGQCPARYDVRVTFYGTDVSNNPYVFDAGVFNTDAIGPVSYTVLNTTDAANLTTTTVRFFDATGAMRGQALSARLKAVGEPTVTWIRKDGQPDNCGDGPVPPVQVPPPERLYIPTPIPNPIGPPIVVPVVIPVGFLVKPEIQINVGPFNVNIGPNEINFSPNFGSPSQGSRPSEPSLPGQPRPPVNVEASDCPDPCPDFPALVALNVPVISCVLDDDGIWKPVLEQKAINVFQGTENVTLREFEQLLPLNDDECFRRNGLVEEAMSLITSGVATDEVRIFDITVPEATRVVMLEIVPPIPPSVSLYALSTSQDPNGKFGTIQSRFFDLNEGSIANMSEAGYIWTLKTFHRVEKVRGKEKGIRLTMRSGIRWNLYDVGERQLIRRFQ